MDYLRTNVLFHLYTNPKMKQPIISDRSVEELSRIAVRQLIRAEWVIKDRAGNIVKTYKEVL